MPGYEVQLRQHESIPVAVVRRQARANELSRLVPECCGIVWNALRAQQIRGGRHIAIYWDDGIRVEIGAEVNGPFAEQDELVRSATPAGLVASVIHMGPYGGLAAAHDAVQAWCSAHSHRLAGPNWEIYGHWKTEWDTDPSQIRTDVFYLVSAA
jgi:effector-binding domain-containing protein